MPFVYSGSKKGVAARYPPPASSTIIEPFAGSAGYALHYATPAHRVILVERDARVVALWRRLQSMTIDDVLAIDLPALGDRITDPLVALTLPGIALDGKWQRVMTAATSKILRGLWPARRYAIACAIPLIKNWQVIEGDYTDAPDVRATWFIDPPYQNVPGGYTFSTLDYAALAEWCQARRGQVIACEQDGATWLPFRPLRVRSTGAHGAGDTRRRSTEAIWTRTPANMLATPRARAEREAARARRAARIAR